VAGFRGKVFWLILVVLSLSGCAERRPVARAPQAGEVRSETHFVMSGLSLIRYELGHLYVPENRAHPKSRLIAVRFMRIPGTVKDAPPVFMLPGGPGDSYIEAFTRRGWSWFAASRQRRDVLRFRAAGDVVVMDQRGASGPDDRLVFNANPDGQRLDRPANLHEALDAEPSIIERALADYSERDLAGYTVVECARDLDALRRALGYEKVNLYGLSYGSQWSFAVMRLFPETVGRALLSGVEPLDSGYDMPSHVWAALMRIATEAEADPRFRKRLPSGGFRAAIDHILARLETSPATVRLSDGRLVVLGPDDFRLSLIAPAADWPRRVLAVYEGRYEDWAREVAASRQPSTVATSALIGPLIDTSLNVSEQRGVLLREDPAVRYLGAWSFALPMAMADRWPTADVGDSVRLPVESSIPIVFLQGDWDTSTPLENSREIQPYFARSKLIVVHRGGHGAVYDVADEHPDLMEDLIEYLRTGAMDGLPSRVELEAVRFDPVEG
jgi:pimeloyl-ACP methyl ester carboxylesterase